MRFLVITFSICAPCVLALQQGISFVHKCQWCTPEHMHLRCSGKLFILIILIDAGVK